MKTGLFYFYITFIKTNNHEKNTFFSTRIGGSCAF